jgi:hypothetical protein
MHALLFMELSEGDDSNRIGEIISVDVVKLLCGKAHNAQQLVIACTSRSKKKSCSPNNTTINNALSIQLFHQPAKSQPRC